MVEFEADDALAAGAARFADQAEQVVIATPDKDLAQCVRGEHVVMLDRRRKNELDEDGVRAKFGVPPALDPRLARARRRHRRRLPGPAGLGRALGGRRAGPLRPIEAIPADRVGLDVQVRGAERLAATLAERRDEALLYKRLATLREDVPIAESLDDLEWRGARPELRDFCARLGFDGCRSASTAGARREPSQGFSRTHSTGDLSARSPRNEGCRSLPSAVHSVNGTCASCFGFTHVASRIRGAPTARPSTASAHSGCSSRRSLRRAGADLAGVVQLASARSPRAARRPCLRVP